MHNVTTTMSSMATTTSRYIKDYYAADGAVVNVGLDLYNKRKSRLRRQLSASPPVSPLA